MRVTDTYYRMVAPVQTRALDYSRLAFPAYRFLLPEVLAHDWLAMVDWHGVRRDHSIHQPLTAYIVLKLLSGDGSASGQFCIGGKPLLDICVDQILESHNAAYLREFLRQIGLAEGSLWLKNSADARALWRSLFVEVAYLAATFHDMGYPWQFIAGLSGKLDHASFLDAPLAKHAEQIVSTYGNRLLFCALNGFKLLDRVTPATWHHRLCDVVGKAIVSTHGFPGALGFLFLNDVLREFPRDYASPIRLFCLEWAATAIMLHDMVGIYWGDAEKLPRPANPHLRLRFSADPLSSLIALADVIEEFSRPLVKFQHCPVGVTTTYHAPCAATDLFFDDTRGVLNVAYEYETRAEVAEKLAWIDRDRHGYFHPHHGYLDLSSAGIQRVELTARLLT